MSKVLGIDVDAMFYNAQEAARRMLAAKKPGAIINIAPVGVGLRCAERHCGLRGFESRGRTI